MGSWLSYQHTNYKKKGQIMKNENIYNRFTNFITEYQEYFLDNETQWNNNPKRVKAPLISL